MAQDSRLTTCAQILAPVSLGELVDKITILEIKAAKLKGAALGNVTRELTALKEVLAGLPIPVDDDLKARLMGVNQELWAIEDAIRDKEAAQDFGPEFIQLARSVYQKNDLRAALKKTINTSHGSMYVEEKSYGLPATENAKTT